MTNNVITITKDPRIVSVEVTVIIIDSRNSRRDTVTDKMPKTFLI